MTKRKLENNDNSSNKKLDHTYNVKLPISHDIPKETINENGVIREKIFLSNITTISPYKDGQSYTGYTNGYYWRNKSDSSNQNTPSNNELKEQKQYFAITTQNEIIELVNICGNSSIPASIDSVSTQNNMSGMVRVTDNSSNAINWFIVDDIMKQACNEDLVLPKQDMSTMEKVVLEYRSLYTNISKITYNDMCVISKANQIFVSRSDFSGINDLMQKQLQDIQDNLVGSKYNKLCEVNLFGIVFQDDIVTDHMNHHMQTFNQQIEIIGVDQWL